MRSNDEYRQILRLWDAGESKLGIARKLGIPRTTVRDCISKFGSLLEFEDYLIREDKVHWRIRSKRPGFRYHYAYMLGVYLGDGYIATHPRTYRLRVVLDLKYPKIIQRVTQSMSALVPNNSVHTVDKIGCIEIACYSNDWVEMFPQHGEGVKHTREIILESWQQTIVDEYILEFIRGLYHSDGCRTVPKSKGKKLSPRYYFTNYSQDIKRMFRKSLEKIGLHSTEWGKNVTVSRKADVAFLDEHIGPKA